MHSPEMSSCAMPANVVVAEHTNAIASAGSCVRLLESHSRNFRRRSSGVVFGFVGEDVAASGAFFIACAADENVVDASSVVGSVGGGERRRARLRLPARAVGRRARVVGAPVVVGHREAVEAVEAARRRQKLGTVAEVPPGRACKREWAVRCARRSGGRERAHFPTM